MPAYYKEFRCKADKCRNTCCSGWRIPVTRQEYLSMVTLDCSEELDRKILNSFVEPEDISDERFRYINFNWQGYCHLYEDGLCLLHKEMGDKCLPDVCRLYPRSLKNVNGYNIATCSSSCEKTVELLIEGRQSDVITLELDETPRIFIEVDDRDINEIYLFQLIVQKNNLSLVRKLEDICTLVNRDEFVRDYNADITPLTVALKALKGIPSSDYGFIDLANKLIDRYENNPEYYEEDKVRFEEAYPEWMSFFERIINNSLMYDCFPFVDKRLDKTSAYKGLCACYGLLRLFSIGQLVFSTDRDDLVDAICLLFRNIEHSAFYYNINILCPNAAVLLKM